MKTHYIPMKGLTDGIRSFLRRNLVPSSIADIVNVKDIVEDNLTDYLYGEIPEDMKEVSTYKILSGLRLPSEHVFNLSRLISNELVRIIEASMVEVGHWSDYEVLELNDDFIKIRQVATPESRELASLRAQLAENQCQHGDCMSNYLIAKGVRI